MSEHNEMASCFLHGDFYAGFHRCPTCHPEGDARLASEDARLAAIACDLYADEFPESIDPDDPQRAREALARASSWLCSYAPEAALPSTSGPSEDARASIPSREGDVPLDEMALPSPSGPDAETPRIRAIIRELQAISDDTYGGAHPFVRYYRGRVRQALAVAEALLYE